MLDVLQETLYYLQEQNYQLQLYCKLPEVKVKKFKYLQNEIILMIIQQLSKVVVSHANENKYIKQEYQCDLFPDDPDYKPEIFGAREEEDVHEEATTNNQEEVSQEGEEVSQEDEEWSQEDEEWSQEDEEWSQDEEIENDEEIKPDEMSTKHTELNNENSLDDKVDEEPNKWLLGNLKSSETSGNTDVVGEKNAEKETIVVDLNNTKPLEEVQKDLISAPVLSVPVQLTSETTITQVAATSTPPKHSCGYCSLSFARKKDKKKHELTHSNEFPYACKPCNRRYRGINGFRRHQASCHGQDRSQYLYKCKFCSVKLRTWVALQVHMQTHEEHETESYKCELCEKIFNSNYEMRAHMFAHAGTNSFRCPFCPSKNFRILTTFSHHMKSHGMKIFNCTKCRGVVTNKLNTIFEHYEAKHLKPPSSAAPTSTSSSSRSNLSGFPINDLTFKTDNKIFQSEDVEEENEDFKFPVDVMKEQLKSKSVHANSTTAVKWCFEL